jgi:hypothetical protein
MLMPTPPAATSREKDAVRTYIGKHVSRLSLRRNKLTKELREVEMALSQLEPFVVGLFELKSPSAE